MFEGMTREGDVAIIAGRNLAAHYLDYTCVDVLRSLDSDGCFYYLFEAVFLLIKVSVGARGEICPLTMLPRGVSATPRIVIRCRPTGCQLPSTNPAEGVASAIFSFLRTILISPSEIELS